MSEPPSWLGFDVDERDGSRVGSVHGFYLDAESGEPAWLVAGLGRRRVKPIAIPISDCAAAAGRVWVAHGKETLSSAPAVDPARPLLREHELAICSHYGIGEGLGRAAKVSAREQGAIVSKPG
jgi:PRC-barrel domain